MYIVSSNPTVTNCNFSQNSAGYDGGGMVNYQSSNPTVTNCVFTGNTASSYGGGMDNEQGSSPNLTHCLFSGNRANEGGGGVYNKLNGSPTLTDCILTENRTDGWGGGMFNTHSSPILVNCSFTRNFGWIEGGGIYNFQSSPTVTNGLFSANSSGYGAGMSNDSNSRPTLTHCTFTANSADEVGGGIYNAASSPTVTNCILWGDIGGEISGGSPTVTFSNVQGMAATPEAPDSNHNFGADPLFVRNPTPGEDNEWGTADDDNGDLHLQANSPCINKGSASAPALPPYDMDFYARNQEGAPDLGADEVGSGYYIVADFYVDKVNGNDTTGTGTSDAPFKTITKALSQVSAPIGLTVIHVKAGNYSSDRPRVRGRVRFVNWGNTGQASIGKQ